LGATVIGELTLQNSLAHEEVARLISQLNLSDEDETELTRLVENYEEKIHYRNIGLIIAAVLIFLLLIRRK